MDDQAQVTLGDGTAFAVPSGQIVALQDIIWNSQGPDGPVARFRFIASDIARDGGSIDAETAGQDMLHLCQTIVLAKMTEHSRLAQAVVISMADRSMVFGEANPDATQYFESFRIEGDICIGELF
jgi:hypothetical protein